MADVPYPRVHVVINPASGKDEPILNTLNDVFHQHGVEWDVSITHKYGDAREQARAAIESGADLVAGYGGDGTQHEIANAVVRASRHGGRTVTMGVLPGGTGNGFARELGIPGKLRDAAILLCTSRATRAIDVGHLVSVGKAEVDDRYFIQRLYIGVEPEEQTSREDKNKYGVFAYAVNMAHRSGDAKHFRYQVDIDGETGEVEGTKAYLINSGMMGTGLKITHTYSIDDGLLDCFVVDKDRLETLVAATERFLAVPSAGASRHFRQARSVSIDVDPDQPIWADGEYIGRTPLKVDVLPGALRIVVA
jgi:YegS/Rv2252/BmrU family lipid kinase